MFNYQEPADAAILSGRVDISRTHCITRDEVLFALESSWAFKRESDRKVTDRTKQRRRERER